MNKARAHEKTMLQYRELFAAVLKQAHKDAPKPGHTGHEARHWLEFFAIPYLDALKMDARALYSFVIETEKSLDNR